MVERGGPAKIMDFGIARMRSSDVKTQTGILLGSPKYMAPEQLLGRGVDHRCDIFALGVVLYEMAVGRRALLRRRHHADHVPDRPLEPAGAERGQRAAAADPRPRPRARVGERSGRALPERRRARRGSARRPRAAPRRRAAARARDGGRRDDASQTLPIGSFSLPRRRREAAARALAPEQILAADPSPSRRPGSRQAERAEPGAAAPRSRDASTRPRRCGGLPQAPATRSSAR